MHMGQEMYSLKSHPPRVENHKGQAGRARVLSEIQQVLVAMIQKGNRSWKSTCMVHPLTRVVL